jgi:hypothetical protein
MRHLRQVKFVMSFAWCIVLGAESSHIMTPAVVKAPLAVSPHDRQQWVGHTTQASMGSHCQAGSHRLGSQENLIPNSLIPSEGTPSWFKDFPLGLTSYLSAHESWWSEHIQAIAGGLREKEKGVLYPSEKEDTDNRDGPAKPAVILCRSLVLCILFPLHL